MDNKQNRLGSLIIGGLALCFCLFVAYSLNCINFAPEIDEARWGLLNLYVNLRLGAIVVCCVVVPVGLYLLDRKYNFTVQAFDKLKANKKFIFKNIIAIVCSFVVAAILDLLFNLFLSMFRPTNGLLSYRHIFFFSGCIFIIYWLVTNVLQKNHSVEKLFVAIILTLGISMIFVSPVGHVGWDLESHYKICVSMASPYGSVTEADANIYDNAGTITPIKGDIKNDEREDLFNSLNNTDYISNWKPNVDIAQIPCACMLACCRVLHIPFCTTLKLMELVNLLLYTLFCCLAIKQLKSGKIILMVIALIPTCVFQATSISYDYWVISLMILGVASFLGEAQQPDKHLTVGKSILMYGAIALACLPKQVYLPMLFLPMFLCKSEFKGCLKKRSVHIGLGFLVFVLIAASLLFRSATEISNGGDMRGGGNVNAAEQIGYILHNPIVFGLMFTKFLSTYLTPTGLEDCMATFGQLYKALFGGLYMVVISAAIFTDKNEFDKHTHTWLNRALTWVLYLGVGALIALAFYIVFTPVGASTVLGCQERYLLPLLFAPLAVLGSCKIKNNINPVLYVNGFGIVCSVFLVLCLFQNFFLMVI